MLLIKVNNIVLSDKHIEFKNFPEPIQYMELQIAENKYIGLRGFEAYVRLKEMYKGVNTNIQGMSKIILMGKYKNDVAIVTIDMKTGKFKQEIKKIGREYNNRPINENVWKKGLKTASPEIYIREEK